MKFPRLCLWLLIAVLLLIFMTIFNPQQLPVVLYKACLVTGGVVLGYWLDRSLFHYGRPHEFFQMARQRNGFEQEKLALYVASLAMLRRTVIVLACVLGLTLGL